LSADRATRSLGLPAGLSFTTVSKSKILPVSRTVNPLHFEDLEPHRFEDLIRQLAYSFRPWRRLEATGRLGADGGLDVRGVELLIETAAAVAGPGEDDEPPVTPLLEEREWRIQCKRYKSIPPKLMREIVAETVPDPSDAPYGLIVAAACDVSAKAMAAFHEERHRRGVAEGHLWTKAHLEDLLFLPENDHLLFVYFGLSLRAKQRSRLQQVQSILSTKRKLLRAFGVDSLGDLRFKSLLVRDIADETYPESTPPEEEDILGIYPWFAAEIIHPYSRGLMTFRHVFDGWVREDGSWDILPGTAFIQSDVGRDFRFYRQTDEQRIIQGEKSAQNRKLFDLVPAGERAVVRFLRMLPFSSVLEVDTIGDTRHEGVHLYCRYVGEKGPFEDERFMVHAIVAGADREFVNGPHRPLFREIKESGLRAGSLSPGDVEMVTFLAPRKPKQIETPF
jgi:hypothetical protein